VGGFCGFGNATRSLSNVVIGIGRVAGSALRSVRAEICVGNLNYRKS
jgi:hypothetical protein